MHFMLRIYPYHNRVLGRVVGPLDFGLGGMFFRTSVQKFLYNLAIFARTILPIYRLQMDDSLQFPGDIGFVA